MKEQSVWKRCRDPRLATKKRSRTWGTLLVMICLDVNSDVNIWERAHSHSIVPGGFEVMS